MMTFNKKTIVILILFGSMMLIFSGCSLKKINSKRAMFLYQDGIKLSSQGDFDGALDKFNQSINISEKNGFIFGVAHNYNEIGNIYTYKNKFDIAREYFQKALNIYKENNMRSEVSKSLDNLTKTYVRQGNYNRAVLHYEELISWDKSSKNMLGAGIATFNLAHLHEKYLLNYEKAKTHYQEALNIFLELNSAKEVEAARQGIKRMTF